MQVEAFFFDSLGQVSPLPAWKLPGVWREERHVVTPLSEC